MALEQFPISHIRKHQIASLNDHEAGNHKLFYSNGSGQLVELSLGEVGGVLTAMGAAQAPVFTAALRKNFIINGDFRIWQRGSSFLDLTSHTWVADRFRWLISSTTGRVDITKGSGDGSLFHSSMALTNDIAEASPASDAFFFYRQNLEAQNLQQLLYGSTSARTVTISFWVKSSVTGTYCITLRQSDVNRSYVAEYTISAANTWEYKVISIVGDTSGVINNDSGSGMQIMFWLDSGADARTATAGSWYASSGDDCTNNQVAFMATVDQTWNLAQVKLELGSVATPFIHRNISEELILCQRYFEKSYDIDTDPGTITSTGAFMYNNETSGDSQFFVPFKVAKRIAPTITTYGKNDGVAGEITVAAVDSPTGGGVGASQNGFRQITTLGSSTPELVYCHWAADAEL